MSRTTLNVMFLMKTLHCFQVCQSWKKLGVRMNLSCYIGYIQSQEKSNSASLRMLLRLWSSAKPESYNVKSLKRVLAAEVMISCAADLLHMDGSKANVIIYILLEIIFSLSV